MDPAAERKMQFLFSLRSHGVTNKRVLTAMEKVDRGKYIRGTFEDRAYEDTPLPIACGQTISQPSIVALMTEALDVQPRSKVLEIGTGSGYQAAILSQLARRVYTVDGSHTIGRVFTGGSGSAVWQGGCQSCRQPNPPSAAPAGGPARLYGKTCRAFGADVIAGFHGLCVHC